MSSLSRETKILAKIYAAKFQDNPIDFLSSALETDWQDLSSDLEQLRAKNLVIFENGVPSLTPSGRAKIKVVMAGGAFDIIHPGHLETLEQAKSLGDALIVSVARDATFRRNKKREPQHDEALRRKLVSSLKIVDAAVLGSEKDILGTAEMIRPDIVAIGYDQTHDENSIKSELAKRGVNVEVVRLQSTIPEIKTSSILKADSQEISRL